MRDNIVPVVQDHSGDETITKVSIEDRLDNLSRAMNEFNSALEHDGPFWLFQYIHDDFEKLKGDINIYISKG